MTIIIVIAVLLVIMGVLYIAYGPKQPSEEVVIEHPAFEIPIVISEEKLAEIPVHKVVKAKIRKLVPRKKVAKKK